ncbi:MBL fold metallo-hydrolase [Lysinibacillus antri]|uniref:MBL fold metallo-hydrolase n=1 Tax=Lysinibacillus antri TaxID=2498145 RepID=A0A432LEQ7_9BACI|nr:MBL fold metallo-hydrolase [Lysinibacillus antri]RUL55528.1 MBL fold metallo-hydrolase [Lysinibacillus antri]
MLKKSVEYGEINGVSFANGTVSFNAITLNVYSYMVDGVLIDTGAKSLKKQFAPFLLSKNYDQVVITHHHEDHTGCAALIEKDRNIPIYIHEMSVNDCRKPSDYPLYRKLFWGKRDPFKAKPLSTSFSSRTAKWDVIETPGHAKDHVAFLNRNTGQLFSGDLFVQPRTKVILRNESIPQIIASIEHVLTLDFGEMYCCHAGFVKNGKKALEQKREYLLELKQKVLDLYQNGMNPSQIHQIVMKRKYPITKLSFGEWDSMHIITSILNESKQMISN